MKSSNKIIFVCLTFILIFSGTTVFGQDTTAAIPTAADKPMYEKFGMTPTQLFALMVSFTLLLVWFVISLSSSAKNILEYKKSKMKSGSKIILALFGLGISSGSFAADVTDSAVTKYTFSFPDEAFWALLTLDIILVMLILYLRSIIKNVASEYTTPSKIIFFKNLNHSLTDSIPLEQESSILMDHDYDGIKELDNNLPPWWKYGFYLTIVWAVGYMFYYQILEIGHLQAAEYQAEMEAGDIADAEYKAAHPELITADNVVLLEDPASLAQGKSVYTTYCFSCHMEGGKGGIGPNLTDKNWIYDGDLKGVFTTITNGAQNGMVAWKEFIPANEIQAVTSYILKLEYLAPPFGKVPQGDNIFE